MRRLSDLERIREIGREARQQLDTTDVRLFKTLKIATVAPEGSTWMKVMRQIDSEIREATGNDVGFKIYPGGVQGDEKVVLRKTRTFLPSSTL